MSPSAILHLPPFQLIIIQVDPLIHADLLAVCKTELCTSESTPRIPVCSVAPGRPWCSLCLLDQEAALGGGSHRQLQAESSAVCSRLQTDASEAAESCPLGRKRFKFHISHWSLVCSLSSGPAGCGDLGVLFLDSVIGPHPEVLRGYSWHSVQRARGCSGGIKPGFPTCCGPLSSVNIPERKMDSL